MASTLKDSGRKATLLVLFVPSVERDGITPVPQDDWVREALDTLGRLFGGATAFPKAHGVWRDDERGGRLIHDEPVVIHSYTSEDDLEDDERLAILRQFCRLMGRVTKQGEIGLVIGDSYLAIRDFSEG